MEQFLNSNLTAKEFIENQLSEMPHVSLPYNKSVDLHIEDHIQDTPQEFLIYMDNLIDSTDKSVRQDLVAFLLNDESTHLMITKVYGRNTLEQLLNNIGDK